MFMVIQGLPLQFRGACSYRLSGSGINLVRGCSGAMFVLASGPRPRGRLNPALRMSSQRSKGRQRAEPPGDSSGVNNTTVVVVDVVADAV